MAERQVFTISETDWAEIERLSRAAMSAPVVLLGGVDLSQSARAARQVTALPVGK
jgi:hypothetical protein